VTQRRGQDAYAASGVDIARANRAIAGIAADIERTKRAGAGSIGGFGATFELPPGYVRPVLVSGTDGVGTKLKVAFALDRHDTVGIDLVAMCVNDVIAQGARPLYFLDYFATSRLDETVFAQVVRGIADGCVAAEMALVGGETAEMPGFYADGEYDLSGFATGVVEHAALVDGSAVQPGDVLLGLASSGVHSNGFSLIRKLVSEAGADYGDRLPGLDKSLGETLLEPTRIYVRAVRELQQVVEVRGMAHITGGGLVENPPRAFGPQLGCAIDITAWPLPPVFAWLQKLARLDRETLYRTFNMGIGFVAIVPNDQADEALAVLARAGQAAYVIGSVEAGFQGVRLEAGGVTA
jgi:phosphoribosylformylglycinamidine cyclo-ligase